MTTLAVTSVSSLLCQASTCFRIGSKFRCIRSTPTEMQSMSEKDFECFASTGVNTFVTMFPNWLSPAGPEANLVIDILSFDAYFYLDSAKRRMKCVPGFSSEGLLLADFPKYRLSVSRDEAGQVRVWVTVRRAWICS